MRPPRRLFALVPDCHASAPQYGEVWRRHFYDGLAGELERLVTPEGVDFGWARPAASPPDPAQRARTSEELRRHIDRALDHDRVEGVVSLCFGHDVDPGLVERVVERGVPWINFFCDSAYAFDLVAPIARVTSLNWFVAGVAEQRYAALGVPFLHRPYAVNPRALPQITNGPVRHPALFVGLSTGNRANRLARLKLLGCDIEVRGRGWNAPPERGGAPRWTKPGLLERLERRTLGRRIARRAGAYVTDEQLPHLLGESAVVLGLNEGRTRRGRYVSYLKLRDVELPGFGCCYLTQHNRDVEAAFEVGREVATFRSSVEGAWWLHRLNADPDRRRAMARAARRRVLGEHTWATRLGELWAAL